MTSPDCRLLPQGSIQSPFVLICQSAPAAFWEIAQQERSDGNAEQPQHVDAKWRQHAADVAILAFIEHDLEPGIFFTRTEDTGTLGAQETAVIAADSAGNGFEQRSVRDRANLYVIGFVEMGLGREHKCCPVGIVG
jgi:hypothetical protein